MVARANNELPTNANLYEVFDSVVQVVNTGSYGSGAVLKGTNFIITSAHVAVNSTTQTDIYFSKYGETARLKAAEIFVHPLYKSDGSTPQYDLALVRLNGTPPSWAPGYELQEDPTIYGETVWFAGYGMQSIGGQQAYYPGTLQKSWGANVTDFPRLDSGNITPSNWDEAYLAAKLGDFAERNAINKAAAVTVLDFDDGSEQRNALKYDGNSRYGEYGIDTEAIPQPGDSGGPILNARTEEILGITTAGYTTYYDPDWSRFGNYGELSVNVSPRHYSGWIEFITNGFQNQATFSSSAMVNYDGIHNIFTANGNIDQTFKITLSDWDSSHIFAPNPTILIIDTADDYLRVVNFSRARVKFGDYGFGYDIRINSSDLSLVVTDAPKTPVPMSFPVNLNGTAQPDSFNDSTGISERISGQGGNDTFFVSGRWFLDYDVEVDGNTTIVRNFDNEEVDVLIDFERLRFSDGKVIGLDIDGSAGQAFRIYKAAFNRDPTKSDYAGLGYWVKQIDNGMDLIEVSARFIDSDEFRTLYGANPSNGTFLTKVYNNVLGRDPDAGGYAWWIDQLESNPDKTWEKVLADFAESPENQNNVIDIIGNGIVFEAV